MNVTKAPAGKKIIALWGGCVKIRHTLMSTIRSLSLSLLLAFVSLGVVSSLEAVNAEDWTLESVLKKVEEANGGIDAIESVTNLRVRGEIVTPDMAYDFLLLKKRPNMVRIHLMFPGRSVENGFDGKKAWRRVWIKGVDRVEELSGADLAKTNLDLDFDGPLIGEALPGMEREFEGVERIDRVDYFIVLVKGEHVITRHYIDSRNFREWKTVREVYEDGEVVSTATSIYSDYQRHKTIWLAHRIRRILSDGSEETVVITEAEVDPGILDRAFAIPRQWSSAS